MSKTLDQIFIANPITSNANTDLMYFVQSPYTPGTDAGMTFANFKAQFDTQTPAALTKTDDTNVTLTLGGTPATALLQATSLTLGWTGTLSGTRGGTGVNNGASTITLGGSLTTSGAFASTFTMTGITAVTFPTSGTLATTSQIPTGAALTKTDDTNVTLTLGGSPTTALVNAASLTLGWTGQLGLTRGGTNASLTASNGGIVWSNASQFQILSGTATANLPLLSGSTATPTWGSFALSLGGALTTAGALTTSGAFASTFTMTNTTAVTFPTSGTLATTSQLPTPAALTAGNDTNVTLTLGGTPATALLQASSITAGWSGTLSLTRGGTAASLTASNGGIVYSTGSALAILAGTSTANQLLMSGASTTPAWSTATYPATAGTSGNILQSNGTNILSVSPASALPAGTMFNLQSTTLTTVFSITGSSYTSITGLSAAITPTSSSNKVLVRAIVNLGTPVTNQAFCQLLRGATPIGIATSVGSRTASGAAGFSVNATGMVTVVLEFLDSPATTSTTTYTVQALANSGGTILINSSSTDTNGAGFPRTSSTITVIEVHA